MPAIFLVLGGALLAGVLLAGGAAEWPVRPGLLGLGMMLAVAFAVRRRWGLLADAAPGSPERMLWVSMAANAVVAAHLLAALFRIGPSMVMHTPVVHALGVDSWTLVAGALLAYWVVREPNPRADERDEAIAARGMRAAHYALLIGLLVQILTLGFVHEGWVADLSRPTIAHAMILAIMASAIVDGFVRLQAYAREAAAGALE